MNTNTYRDISTVLDNYLANYPGIRDGMDIIFRKLWGTYGASPIGVVGNPTAARAIIFGWDGIPAGAIAYGGQHSPKGEFSYVWKLYSPNIKKEKGESYSTKAAEAKGLLARLKKDIIKPVDLNCMTRAHDLIPVVQNHSFGGIGGWAPSMDASARYQALEYLTGRETEIGLDLKEWIAKATKDVSADNEAVDKARRLRKAFSSRALLIHKLGYGTDKPFIVREVALPANSKLITELTAPKFFSSIDELTDYPHVIGAFNLHKLRYPEKDIFDTSGFHGYKDTYNCFYSDSNVAGICISSLLFPAVFDELPKTQEPKTEPNQGLMDIFSLDI